LKPLYAKKVHHCERYRTR